MRTIILDRDVIDELFRQPRSAASDGGWQNLIAKLQRHCNRETGELSYDETTREQIERNATHYGDGGWQNLLKKILEKIYESEKSL
jgi:hypothetical protein